jgi:hypothetical protein
MRNILVGDVSITQRHNDYFISGQSYYCRDDRHSTEIIRSTQINVI